MIKQKPERVTKPYKKTKKQGRVKPMAIVKTDQVVAFDTSKLLYFDFEYNDSEVLMMRSTDRVGAGLRPQQEKFDLVVPATGKPVSNAAIGRWVAAKTAEGYTFVSYALSAEITALLRIGVDVSKMTCIDLMAECRMLTLAETSKWYEPKGSLLGALDKFLGIKPVADKDAMRDLILGDDKRRLGWDDDEWAAIGSYCQEDVDNLPDLFDALRDEMPHQLLRADCEQRGLYIRMAAEMDFASPGFPVSGGHLKAIYKRREAAKVELIESLQGGLWGDLYQQVKPTKKQAAADQELMDAGKQPPAAKYRLDQSQLATVILDQGWAVAWPTTKTGRPSTAGDELKKLERGRIPEVAAFRMVKNTLAVLNSTDLSELITDSEHIKQQTFSFSAKTSRNGLKPAKGYLLNLPRWMRAAVRPAKNKLLIIGDWKAQEVAVAGHLSGDQNLIDAYDSGDIYVYLAKYSGVVPMDALAADYPLERKLFKMLQLGISYGKSLNSLADDIWGLLKGTDMAPDRQSSNKVAERIYDWHLQQFETYWRWAKTEVLNARRKGYIQTAAGGWITPVDPNKTRRNAIMNFPIQSLSAEMMRLSSISYYQEWAADDCLPPLLATQHDSLILECDIQHQTRCEEALQRVMIVAGEDLGVPRLGVDLTVIDSERGYLVSDDHFKLFKMICGGS